MARARTWFLGVGCLLMILVVVVAVIVMQGLKGPSLSKEMILAVNLAGPIAEVTADDPFAELTGDTITSLRDLRTALVRAAEDDRVKGVRLRIDSLGGGLGTVQELHQLLTRVSAAGKWTAAYMDTAGEFQAGNFSYYLASACDEVSINPMGDVNLIGLSASVPFMRGTFDKLGISPEFHGRGDYKTARFFYTRKEFTPAQREMIEWILGSIMDQLVGGIASGRSLEPDLVRNLVDDGPYLGREAIDAGLVDYLEDWGDFTSRVGDLESKGADVVSVRSYLKRGRFEASGPKIAVVTGVGAIMRGASGKSLNPLFGGDIMGSNTIAKAWRDVRKTKGVKAVIFRVDSPGGSAVASEVIRQEMARTAETIPVVVSMSNVAASGGYWISCGAQRIVAYPASQVGSIGVFAGHINTRDFWEQKIGVTYGRIDFGKNADLYGSLDDWDDGQRMIIDRALDRIYDAFTERVAEARDMTVPEVDAVGRGRVFTGEQALEKGLIDAVGGFDVALEHARELAGLDADATVRLVDFPRVVPWWKQLLERGSRDEVELRAALRELEAMWQSGTTPVPGPVWMPPIRIQ